MDQFWAYHLRGKPFGQKFAGPEFRRLLTSMFQYQPSYRPNLAQLKASPWMAKKSATKKELVHFWNKRRGAEMPINYQDL